MCKFHKELAKDIAMNPASGIVDPVAYSITLVALAQYWIDGYMPSMSDCDGYSDYHMASRAGVEAINNSGLNQNLQQIADDRRLRIDAIRRAIHDVIRERGLTGERLNLPKNPMKDSPFLDAAMAQLYRGNPAIRLELKEKADDESHEPLRAAVQDFVSRTGVPESLQKMQEGSFAKLFVEARTKVNPTLMAAYEKIPGGLKGAFKSCAMCAGSGTGGALVSHAGCVLVPVFAGASGSALSAQLMSLMFVTSPALAAGVTFAIDKVQGKGFSLPKIAGSAALGLVMAGAINMVSGHDHDSMPGHDHSMMHSRSTSLNKDSQIWFEAQSKAEQDSIRQSAKVMGLTLPEMINSLCVGEAKGVSKPAPVLVQAYK